MEPSEILMNGDPVIDVRSPAEYEQGHFPNAISFPLFSNEERHQVGLTYKETGKEAAIKLGLQFVGPKLHDFITNAEKIAPDRRLNVYCWRGGMRSASLSWLLQTAGFLTQTIEGGYKSWRKQVLKTLTAHHKFINLAGYTGSGKTEILYALRDKGEQVIDLESLANHMGSAFMDRHTKQPSSEHFENMLALQLLGYDSAKPIWIEDESRSIGKVYMHHRFYNQLVNAPMVLVTRPQEMRIAYLCALYGKKQIRILEEGFKRIEKRIGGQHTKAALSYLEQEDIPSAAKIALRYYDKAYLHAMQRLKREPLYTISLADHTFESAAENLIAWKKKEYIPNHA